MPDPDELPLYIERMNSNTFSWLTCLTITEQRPHIGFRRPDVINISRLRNLVALDIGSSIISTTRNEFVDDSVLRNWGRLVSETGSFPKLQVLIIRNQAGMTSHSLSYLNAFPVLALFGIKDCFRVSDSDEQAAKSLGWTSVDEHGIMAQVQLDITQSSTWDEPIHQCFKRSSTLLPPTKTVDAPMLNFRLGPTPSDILFTTTYNPVIFFRCLRCSTSQNQAIVPVITHPVPRKTHAQGHQLDTMVKRRKLKKQVDLSGCLDDLLGDNSYNTTKSETTTPTPVRINTPTLKEDWPDHRAVKALCQILPTVDDNNEIFTDTKVQASKDNEAKPSRTGSVV